MSEHPRDEMMDSIIDELTGNNIRASISNITDIEPSEKPKTEAPVEEKKSEGKEKESKASATEEAAAGAAPVKKAPAKKKISLLDFEFVGRLGKGSYSEVELHMKKDNQKLYAIKSLDKNFLYRERKQYQVCIEREVLMRLSHPNVIKLFFSFQDKNKLYFALEYCKGGVFSDCLRIYKNNFSKQLIQYYSAEMVLILEYLHSNGIAHRDFKPENLMLTDENHIKVIDFGTAFFFNTNLMNKELIEQINKIKNAEKHDEDDILGEASASSRKATFVGTAEYVSPELLEDDFCQNQADLWALGTLIYKMFTGVTPFYEQTEYLIFQNIKRGTFKLSEKIPQDASDLISKLLVRNPNKRLGAGEPGSENDFNALKSHPFFQGLDWATFQKEPPKLELVSPQKKQSAAVSVSSSPLKVVKDKSVEDEIKKKHSDHGLGELDIHPEGKQLISGLVQKKCGWIFYKPRHMVLFENKVIHYFEPQANSELLIKGKIILNKDVRAELITKSRFNINTPTRKYYFKELEHPVHHWVEIINKVIDS